MSMAKAVFIPPAELVVFLRLSTQKASAFDAGGAVGVKSGVAWRDLTYPGRDAML